MSTITYTLSIGSTWRSRDYNSKAQAETLPIVTITNHVEVNVRTFAYRGVLFVKNERIIAMPMEMFVQLYEPVEVEEQAA